ncbi:MAG: hypothetical protein AB8F94_12780 [Saprospiraceae bacterium]
MKNLTLLITLVFFASCQSQLSNTDPFFDEDIPVKVVQAGVNFSPYSTSDDWYSEISELKEFENYEEENGILLGKKHSIGTYFYSKNPQEKIIILEEIRHLPNGEANFRKLDLVKIKLKDNQFLTTNFCSKEEYDDIPFLAIYESAAPATRRKNIIKAWEIRLDDFQLESISVKNIQCPDQF